MNELLLTGAVAIVTASCIWNFIKFLISRKDGKESELGGIKKAIETLSDKVDRNQAILARTYILRFDDELINGVEHSKEYFSQQLQDIDTYEAYCAIHPDFKNNYAVIASEHIKKTYKELLEEGGVEGMSKIEAYIAYMMELVTNPKHGYDQIHRWGEDYDCSSAIITAVQTVIPVKDAGATYTGNMRKAFEKCGFRAIPYSKGISLIRGDILLNEKYHTAMYIGNGKIAQFSINEKGKTTGGVPGDQTGRESSVGNFYEYSKGWDYVLRYEEKKEDVIVEIKTKQLQRGDICVEVGLVQTLLNRLNYVGKNGRPLTIDNDFGANVEYAVKNFQKSKGIGQDGIVGPKTYDFLFKSNYI